MKLFIIISFMLLPSASAVEKKIYDPNCIKLMTPSIKKYLKEIRSSAIRNSVAENNSRNKLKKLLAACEVDK